MPTPFLVFDAKVALFPAWQDGMPMTGPAPLRDAVEPYFHCLTSIRWSRTASRKESSFGDARRNGSSRAEEISISVNHPEGVVLDPVGHAHRLPRITGRYCLVVVFWNDLEKQWQRWQFFHVQMGNDSFDAGDGSDAGSRPLEFVAEHVEFDSYTSDSPPDCKPQVLGRVDFICGSIHVPCMTYDMIENLWNMTPYSDTGMRMGSGLQKTNLPYCMWDEPAVDKLVTRENSTFSIMQPRVQRVNVDVNDESFEERIPPSDHLQVLWQRRLYFSIRRTGGAKNELLLHHGIQLETNGSPEPIESIEQDQILDESIALFRVLDRVYATIGHDKIAVPHVFPDQVPLTTSLFFKLGDTILDDQGWWNVSV